MHRGAVDARYGFMEAKRVRYCIMVVALFIIGCGSVYDYRLQQPQLAKYDKKLPGDVSFKVAAEDIYHHALGINKYNLHVREAIEKQFAANLQECFSKGINPKNAETTIFITVLDTYTFPIADLINDIRLFFRVEIFKRVDNKLEKQKTLTVYGFGSDTSGNRAIEKATLNAFYQLLPTLEELFIR